MADRYAYIPYIGLFVCVVWGVGETARERRISTVWLVVPAAMVLVTFGMLSRRQIAYWHDSEILWRHTLSVTERNFMAHDGLAHALALLALASLWNHVSRGRARHALIAASLCFIGGMTAPAKSSEAAVAWVRVS